MPRTKVSLPLYSGGYQSDSPWLSSYGCINLFPEPIMGENESINNPNSQGEMTLIGDPGLRLLSNFGGGPHRGMLNHLGDTYIVSGVSVYKYDVFGSKTVIGTLTTTTSPVSMSSNGVLGGHLTIADGEKMWVWDGSTFTDYTSSLLYTNPEKTYFMEGYTFITFANKQTFQISDLYDSTSWNALQFATAELDSGNLLALYKYNRQIWLICENVAEVWYNSGNDFPFDHVPNGLVEWGIAAPNSLASTGNYGLLWLSKNKYGQGEVVRTQGFLAKSVTPSTLLSLWRQYVRIDDAIAFTYQLHGHVFYQITFPTANKTWCYDVTYNMWHEKSSRNAIGVIGKHRAISYTFFNNMHIIGDFENGNIYELDMDTYTDNSQTITRSFTTYHISNKREQLRHNYLELEGESGTNLLSGQGSAPVITLECSDDGGHTFTNARTASWSADAYDFKRIVRWPMLGISRNRVYKISMSDPIKWRFSRIILDITEGLT